MKKLSFLTLSVITAISLNARENPFEMTNAYEEEAARIIETNETAIHEAMSEASYIKEMQEKMQKPKVEDAVKKLIPVIKEEKPKEKVYTKKEVDTLINKTKKQTEYKTKQIVKKELEKELKTTKIEKPAQVVYVKPRPDIIDDELITKKILPFVDIEYNDEKFMIKTDSDISRKFTLDKDNKIIIDYKAKKNFYTKRDTLESKSFKKITVGNHKKENYYRVVIELNSKPSNFEVTYKDKLITISKTN
ncbi:hypothetical protein GCM10012288_14520 [Malaciobacter pacificus]|jgi:hypothetical protein|uniref:AMIN domain-containing protein n=1 Tax=Malaciobacter pacificus TaxID=1080223 RepID=A0A5C2HFA8_9BACT|nr:AMIN domain-containing protein [Malaciobacter pacificus]QEP35514.1 AMIN domain-containing protein [Malaciobacter pacificus]GGD41489.1 hypothetical protein GCM10012288_14520 [Malaciobacter pacificus]